MSSNDNKPENKDDILDNEVTKIIRSEEKESKDDFFTQKFNLTLSKESSIGLRKSTDMLEEMKRKDKIKLKKYNHIDEELPSKKELAKYNALFDAGSAPRIRQMFGQLAPIKHYDLYIKNEGRRRSYRTFQRKFGRTFAHFMHGRMGVDTFFLFFGVLGVGLTLYFVRKRIETRRKYVTQHGIPGHIIEN